MRLLDTSQCSGEHQSRIEFFDSTIGERDMQEPKLGSRRREARNRKE